MMADKIKEESENGCWERISAVFTVLRYTSLFT